MALRCCVRNGVAGEGLTIKDFQLSDDHYGNVCP